jgi:SAM-dependent methyltransferase
VRRHPVKAAPRRSLAADRINGHKARSAKGKAGLAPIDPVAAPAAHKPRGLKGWAASEGKPARLNPDLWYFHAMSLDVIDLRNFYAQRLGDVARRLVGRGIRARFADTPYLGLFREEAERCLAFMPAAQGVIKWPSLRPGLAALTDEFALPLADAAVDRVLLVHALEMSNQADALLREVWRVLASGGRLLAVVPNRRGLWARMDTTPFGHGRPYSRAQIVHLLRETWFTPTSWS